MRFSSRTLSNFMISYFSFCGILTCCQFTLTMACCLVKKKSFFLLHCLNHPARKINCVLKSEILMKKSVLVWWKYSLLHFFKQIKYPFLSEGRTFTITHSIKTFRIASAFSLTNKLVENRQICAKEILKLKPEPYYRYELTAIFAINRI